MTPNVVHERAVGRRSLPEDGHSINGCAPSMGANDRSDRQRASSTNPWWLESSMSTDGLETPLSGSHLGPHTRPQRPCNKAVFREAVCSSFMPLAPPAIPSNANQHRGNRTTNTNTACQEEEVPSKGLASLGAAATQSSCLPSHLKLLKPQLESRFSTWCFSRAHVVND